MEYNIFKIDIFEEGLLIPIIEYEVYNSKTKELLNLNICKDTKINLLLPVNIEENNLFKYNSSNEYYNDICSTYTTNDGTDITLNDRKNEFINNNMSLCEKNCEYDKYNIENKMVKCECEIKIKLPLLSEIIINKDKLYNKLTKIQLVSKY